MADQPLFFDNAPFLGRIEEQSRFRDALRQVMRETSFTARAKDWVSTQDPPPPFVFLLYGEGGMGKSTLAKQLRHIATTEVEFKGHFETLWLDWEARKQLDLKLVARDNVSPETVFEHIYAIFRDAGFGKEFDSYEAALKTRAGAEKKVAQALDATVGEGRERYAGLRELGGKGLAWLVRSGAVGGTPLPIPQEPMAKAFEAVLGGGAEGIARTRDAATTLLRSRLKPDEFDLFTMPNETLARSLADGLWKAAQKKPILLTLDTYEIADRADVWLRVVIKRAGPNVLWVIAGRDNLAESRKYGQTYHPGYHADFSSDRLRVFSMNEFSVSDVAEYFKYRVPERPLDDATAQAIHQAALGIPLAVKEAAAIWQKPTAILSDITGNGAPSRDRDKIVQTMTERFLLHCWDDPRDRQRLYALALAYQPDADLLSAMLDTQDLEAELSELERRHSFVFVTAMKLHDKVSIWLREYLQADVRRKSKDVRDLHQRAATHLRERLAKFEADLTLIEDRCADDNWVIAAIGLTYHLFWLDEIEAWRWFVPRFVESLAYSYDLTDGLLAVSHDCRACLGQNGKKRLKVLLSGNEPARPEDEVVLMDDLMQLAMKGWLKGEGEAERHAILDLRRGQLLFQRKKHAEALFYYERAETGFPSGGETLKKKLGEALYDLAGEFMSPEGQTYAVYSADAERILPKVVTWLPNKEGAWYRLGITRRQSGNFLDALDAHQHAIDMARDDKSRAIDYNGLGNVYADLGRTDEAMVAYERAIELDPKDATPHNGLGNRYSDLGRIDEAIAEYQRAIELDPKDAAPHNGLGNIYRDLLGRTDEAMAAYQCAIELDPKDAAPHNGLGNVYHDLGRTDEAIAAYQCAIKLGPKDAYPHNGLGALYAGLDRTDEAIVEYQRAIKLDPKFAYPHNGLGALYAGLDRTDEAIVEYQRGIELNPKDAWPHNGLGALYADLGRTDEAIVEYQRAIELNPKDAGPHNNLGNVYRDLLGRTDEASAAYLRAIELDPKSAAPHHGLGNVYRDLDRTDEAIVEYQRAIELDPKLAAPRNGLGNVYRDLGRTDEAIVEYTRAIELDPKGAASHSSLVACLRKLGRDAEATEHEKIARELICKENEYSRACFEAICGNADEALALLKMALEKKQTSLAWVRGDPDWDSLRSDPRFIALVGAADNSSSADASG